MNLKSFIFILINTFLLINADQIPVLSYFGPNSQLIDSFTVGKVISSSEFLEQIKNNLNKPSLDLLLVDKLNAQDLSLLQKKFDLKQNVILEPQVESPFQTLDSYAKSKNINVKLHQFDNAEDALIAFSKIQSNSNSIILTGKSSNDLKSRSKRASENDQQPTDRKTNQTSYVFGDQCAAFFDSVSFIDQSNLQTSTVVYLPVSNGTNQFVCNDINGTQTLSITFYNNSGLNGVSINSLDLIFRRSNNSRYYVLDDTRISLADKSKASLIYMGAPYSMETPINYSFVCTRTVFKLQNSTSDTKANAKIWFYIENLQLQPLGLFPNGTNYTFGPINYCQGFFSSGIWMAISASLILTFILAFGVSLLFNVKTMDRFDDPKGKPLNVGAEK